MNILFVDQFAEIGGAQRCLLDLLPAFQEEAWCLRFAIAGEGALTTELRSRGMRVDILPKSALSNLHKPLHEHLQYAAWYWKTAGQLNQIARDFKSDLLYVNGPRTLPPAAFTAWRRRIPLLFHAHNRVLQSSALRILGAHLRLTPARVIACCRYVAHSLRPYHASIDTIYNGVADLRARSRFQSAQSPLIGVIGRIEPEKGQLEFVQAAHLLHRAWPSSRFVVIGAPTHNGNGQEYLQRTMEESRGLPVTFTGWQSDVRDVWRALDMVVVPSLAPEATPRVITEAFSAGVPVVAFSSGGIAELVEDGRTGFLVHTQTPQALANRMLEVLWSDERAVAKVVRNARQRWATDFNLYTYQQRICKIIHESAVEADCCCERA
jgi:glycosyltransferase involved in cell wall biosynthesis